MFQMFRRHQKVLLGSIAVIAIGSMALSAIVPLFYDEKDTKTAVKDLILDPTEALVKLYDHSLDASNRDVIFPEALFTETVINTEIYKQVFFKYKNQIEQEINDVFQLIFSHEPKEVMPGATYYDVVSQISPKMGALIGKLQRAEELSAKDKVELMAEFFQEKSKFPNALMYQYLQAISRGKLLIEPDELTFFGLKNPEDFFGKTLVKQSASFFTSYLKESSKEQKPQILVTQLSKKLKSFYNMNIHPNQFFIACGISPESGLEVLKTLQAFKALSDKTRQDIFLDSLTYQSFHDFAQKQVPVNIFSFTRDLEPKSLEDALYLSTYASMKKSLSYDRYEIKIRTLEKAKALGKMPKKQQYAQALKGYSELSNLMPYALAQNLESDKDKLAAIKSLQGKSKELFETHLQKVFAKDDPLFYQKILQELPVKSEMLCLVKDSKVSPIPGFSVLKDLKHELDMLPENTPVMFDIGDQYIHEIELVSKQLDQDTLSYQDALASGYLKEVVKQDLESTYKDLVKKNPSKFLNADKKIKSLDDAYLDLIEISAKDLKKKMAQVLGISDEVSSNLLIKGYPKMVLQDFMKQGIYQNDFRISKQAGYLHRADAVDTSVIALFQQEGTKLSQIVQDPTGAFCIYEKTGEVEMSEPICDKSAIDILAKEKLCHCFSENVK